MTRTDKQRQYANFFASEAGKALMEELDRLIADNHDKAEEDPDHARDYVMAAKSAREIKDHITRNCNAVRKGEVIAR